MHPTLCTSPVYFYLCSHKFEEIRLILSFFYFFYFENYKPLTKNDKNAASGGGIYIN